MRSPIGRLVAGLPRPARVALDWILTIALAVAIVVVVKSYVVNPYRIPSSSMEPTLHCAEPGAGCVAARSDRVLANRLVFHFRDPRRGEIVVFETPEQAQIRCGAGGTFVKRVIGLPGETVVLRRGVVFVDGKRLEEPYVQTGRRDSQSGTWQVPEDHYFMMGDNRIESCDSRVWGAASRDALIGSVFATYWPPTRFHIELPD